MLYSSFLLGLFFNPEDEGDMLLRKVVDFQRITWRYLPEDWTVEINPLCIIKLQFLSPKLILPSPYAYTSELGSSPHPSHLALLDFCDLIVFSEEKSYKVSDWAILSEVSNQFISSTQKTIYSVKSYTCGHKVTSY
jgi:hypothetical protein